MQTQLQLEPNKQRLMGKVVRQQNFNESSMWSIIKLEPDEVPAHVKLDPFERTVDVKGVSRLVHPGERFIFEGKWVNSPKWGWSFQYNHFERDIPTTEEGIIDYLSSGLFKGIGPKMAKKLVDRFGLDTLEILKYQPNRFTEIKGFSASKLTQVMMDHSRALVYEELLVKLRPYGISSGKIVKIVNHLGKDDALRTIQDNPYALCQSVDGIGFVIADRIAATQGIPANSYFRLEEAVKWVLNESGNARGHCYMPMMELQEDVVKGLKSTGRPVEQTEVARVIADMLGNKSICLETDDQGGQYVFLETFLRMEKVVANKILRLMADPAREFPKLMDKLIDETERALKITYADNQRQAFHSLAKSNVLVITGGPGTGKSTLLKGLVRVLKESFSGINIGMAAPTGKAAKRMMEVTSLDAKTIHRTLGCRPGSDGSLEPQFDEFDNLPFDVLIADEYSMSDLPTSSMLLRALKHGCMLIFIGDVDQLPSVGPGKILQDIIDSGVVPVTRLDRIFRQADTSKIAVNAASINRGQYTNLEWGNDFGFCKTKTSEETADTVVWLYKKFLDEGLTHEEIKVLTPLRKNTATGADALNRRLQAELNPPSPEKGEMVIGERIFRDGDPVMQIKNNYELEVFNGSTGMVIQALPGSLKIQFDEHDEPLIFDRDMANEVMLNYANTVHKAQGSEYHTVILVMERAHYRMLIRRLLYTGITRAKKRVVTVGQKEAFAQAASDTRAEERYTRLKARLQAGLAYAA